MSCDTSLSSRESKALAKKLRHEDPEQFQTLVRMHLSFFLDLTMEEIAGLPEKNKFRPLKWGLAPFAKKIRGPEKDNGDNVPLKTDIVKQINYLVDYLSAEENICEEGIFRRSGKLTRQQELKGLLQRGILPKLKDSKYSVHDVASVLKAFLAELPEPLLTEVYYPAYCQIAGTLPILTDETVEKNMDLNIKSCTEKSLESIELCQNEKGTRCRILKALQLLLLLLPIENRMVLKRIVHILQLTAMNAENNRMSAQNLATLFTPHLLCPRKLSPEAFHMTAQNLSCIVVFIINQANEIFDIPQTLATDIKAYWDRRRLTPNHLLERSISESTAANTVFTFCDRERSAQENVVNPTETALAQLYAHIQSLPESNKKKRLIKQFNKENGQGTPRTKSIGNSIKKHIFCKNAKARGYLEYQQLRAGGCSGEEVFNSPPEKKTPMRRYNLRVKFENNDKISSVSGFKRMPTTDGESEESEESPPKMAREEPAAPGKGDEWRSPPLASPRGASTPHPAGIFSTPSPLTPVHDDMSPITMSAQRMPKAMQEAMITPRSRKPVVALSGSNLCQLGANGWNEKEDLSWQEQDRKMEMEGCDESQDSLTSPFRDYLFSRSVLTTSPADLSFSSQPGDFDPSSSGGEPPLTDSLLYFLDGASPPSSTAPSGTPPSEPSLPPVTETSL